VVICLERGADLHMAQLMPLPLTVSCFSKIQTGFTFLVPAHLTSATTVTDTDTHTHPFNGPFYRTTQVSRYKKGKTSLGKSDVIKGPLNGCVCITLFYPMYTMPKFNYRARPLGPRGSPTSPQTVWLGRVGSGPCGGIWHLRSRKLCSRAIGQRYWEEELRLLVGVSTSAP